MKYALLLYNPPHTEIPEPEREGTIGAMLKEMRTWREDLERAGVFRTGLRLAPVDSATSLRARGRDVLVTDGPFAETKEILGGLILIECADLDEALPDGAGRHGRGAAGVRRALMARARLAA